MDLKKIITALLPFRPPDGGVADYYFALNIYPKNLQSALWKIEGDNLEIINPQIMNVAEGELVASTDKLLDRVVGDNTITPEKILFGVPDSWILDDNIKEGYLKILKNLVKELEIKPMAYVSTSHALTNFLENQEGAPTTAILVGIDNSEVTVTVSRAGRVDGTKLIQRSDNLGEDIEKTLLNFTEVEVLPSRMLIFSPNNQDLTKQKADLLSFPWMDKLSFLHFPKVDFLEKDILIKAVALAGASEINPQVKLSADVTELPVEQPKESHKLTALPVDNFGFVTGDITKESLPVSPPVVSQPATSVKPALMDFAKWLSYLGPKKIFILPVVAIIILVFVYLLFARAGVTIYVEPKTLERDSQVTADPKVKTVDEANKIIPGEIVEVTVSGSDKLAATGKKQVGDNAKGTVKIINNSASAQTLSKGSTISSGGLKFTLDTTVNIASTSATADTKSTAIATATALAPGADSNLPSDTQFSSGNTAVAIIAEGNFSGGTSKEVTVVSDNDQKKLLAQVSSALRKQAAEKLQGKLTSKKVLEEGLLEEITSKSYSKNINDQASEFSLNLTARYKGTAYNEDDLKLIVSKLLENSIAEEFELNLAQTETLADVSKLEKDGKLIFLARFKAKLMPKLDHEKIKQQIKGKTIKDATEILKSHDNILGSDINIVPSLPAGVARLPFLASNIKLEVKLK